MADRCGVWVLIAREVEPIARTNIGQNPVRNDEPKNIRIYIPIGSPKNFLRVHNCMEWILVNIKGAGWRW